jgi:flagellar biosynthesis protein FlhG
MSWTPNTAKKIPVPAAQSTAIWAFGGGKGGIGKSFLTTNIAVCLSQLGHTVTLIDMDVGGANVHTCLGTQQPRLGLSDFLQGKVTDIEDLLTDGLSARLKFIAGVNDGPTLSRTHQDARNRLMSQIKKIKSDFIFLDLGAGASDFNADFFNYAHQSFVVTVPEPTSIENSYQFIRSAVYKKMRQIEGELGSREVFEKLMEQKQTLGIRTPNDLFKHLVRTEPQLGKTVKNELDTLNFKLLINQVRTKTDIDLGYSFKMVCRQYFGIDVAFAGYLDFDNAVWQSARKRQPLVLAFPSSHLAGNLFNLAKSLVESKQNSVIL